MYEASITLRQGEIRPVYGQAIAAPTDTVTILNAPGSPYSAPTFTLLDSSGVAVTGFSGVTIPGANYQGTALAAPLLWFVLNTTGLNPGAYVARFVFAVRSTQDGLTRELTCEVQARVLAGVEVAATYDLATPIGQARLYGLDGDTATAIFSDAEWTQFLADGGGVPILAASLALEVVATDRARVALVVKVGALGSNEVGVCAALQERARQLRNAALVTPVVVSPAPVFMDSSSW